jgi:hypothetical protein
MIGDLHKQNVNPYLTVYYKISTNGFVCWMWTIKLLRLLGKQYCFHTPRVNWFSVLVPKTYNGKGHPLQ